MTYAGGRPTLDADSHLMELPDFLDPFIEDGDARAAATAGPRAGSAPVFDKATARRRAPRRPTDAVRAAAEERLLVDKGWQAMGAFDPAERSHVVDLFGFDGQLVFATFATALFMGKDKDLLYAGSAAHNRAVAAFCEDDPRLLPVAFVPLERHRAGGRRCWRRRSSSAAPPCTCRPPPPATGRPPTPTSTRSGRC